MMVDVPEPIARLLPTDPAQRGRSVLEGVVIGAYTQGIISRGRTIVPPTVLEELAHPAAPQIIGEQERGLQQGLGIKARNAQVPGSSWDPAYSPPTSPPGL